MPVCESCGGSYENTYRFCPFCGRAAPEAIAVVTSPPVKPSALACPKCSRDDNVAKVSAILQRDTHTIQSQVPITSVHTDAYGKVNSDTYWESVSSTQMSHLAQVLLPPPAPVSNSCGLVWSIICAAGIGACILGMLLFSGMTVFGAALDPESMFPGSTQEKAMGIISIVGINCMILAGAAVIGWIGYYYVTKDLKYKKDYPGHRQLWENAMARYDQLYYCFRDDVIFIPGEGTCEAPANLMAYIRWHPYSSKPPFRIFQF